jgi:hypothetical protein
LVAPAGGTIAAVTIDRRPLGTGPRQADAYDTRDTESPPAPRAQLAAERLPATPAAAAKPTRPAGRRVLGIGTESPAFTPDEKPSQ